MGRIITKTLDQCGLTKADAQRLKALADPPDSETDLSDMPELDEKFWKDAIRNPFCEKLAQSPAKTRQSK